MKGVVTDLIDQLLYSLQVAHLCLPRRLVTACNRHRVADATCNLCSHCSSQSSVRAGIYYRMQVLGGDYLSNDVVWSGARMGLC